MSYVTIDITTEQYSAQYSIPASSVEQCQCPPNYQGLSCEECAPGYYRVQSGPYGGYCVRCQCNGHADTCDVNTGVCHVCFSVFPLESFQYIFHVKKYLLPNYNKFKKSYIYKKNYK